MENAKWTREIYILRTYIKNNSYCVPSSHHLLFIQDHAAVTGRNKSLCRSFPLMDFQARRLWCSTAIWDMRPADVFTLSGRALKVAFRIHPGQFKTISNLKAPNPTSHLPQPAASSDVVDVVGGNRPGWTFQLQTKAGADSRTMISGRTRIQLMGTGAR